MITKHWVFRSLVLGFAILGCTACGSASASADDDFIPGFDRVFLNGDKEFFAFDSDSPGQATGKLTGNHHINADDKDLAIISGSFSHSNFTFSEAASSNYRGHFTGVDTISLIRNDGVQLVVTRSE